MSDDFRQTIYDLVACIPAGSVATYGQLSLMAGRPRSARIVGQLMSRCPEGLNLPCHRVIKSDGSLCEGTLWGHMQREMLRQEGVPFKADGRVDLRACRWGGA